MAVLKFEENYMLKKIAKFVLKYVNLKGMIKEAVDVHLEKFIMDAVAKSETKIDDGVVPLVYAAIEKQALTAIDEADIEELLGLKDEEAK